MKFFFNYLLFIAFLLCASYGAQAQSVAKKKASSEHVYEDPSMENFSKLYWAVSALDIENDMHIDNYLLINECDIYKDYFSHEFEWRSIRAAAKEFLQNDVNQFPLRFQFTQPLRLGEYSFDDQRFDILEEYRINATRRFQVLPPGYDEDICGFGGEVAGYPRGIIMELSRPFSLLHIPMEQEAANIFITKKLDEVEAVLRQERDADVTYDYRDAYLVTKVKVFSYQGKGWSDRGRPAANVLAILESIEVYEDRDKKNLMYSEDFRKRKRSSKMEDQLKTDYQLKNLSKKQAAHNTEHEAE